MTRTGYVTVDGAAEPLDAEFTGEPVSGFAPLDVQFFDQSTGDLIAWDWTFGDGGISGARHPLHTYDSAGTYTVSLTVYGPEGSDVETKESYIEVSSAGTTWTFILYFAGDNNLHPAMERAIDRMERVADKYNVSVLVLWDGWQHGDTRLYRVTYDTSPGIASPTIPVGWNAGEMNTGNTQTLVHFVDWARVTYPADHYFLSIADHGRGTTGIAWDVTSGGDKLSAYAELGSALDAISNGGSDKLDVLFLDACLMGMIEDAYEVKDDVDYFVASENLGWSVFAYDRYISSMTSSTTPSQLAQNVTHAYMDALHGYPGTISALDMSAVESVGSATDAFAQALDAHLGGSTVSQVIGVRNQVQTFDSRNYTVLDSTDEYVDLYHLAELVKVNIPNTIVQDAAQSVLDAVDNCVIAERHQSGQDPWSGNYWDLDDAHGIALYFPPRSHSWDYANYVTGGSWAFCNETAWDEFLVSYFMVSGLPAETPINPGVPTMPEVKMRVFLPVVIRNN
jgi:PKD repeat protein